METSQKGIIAGGTLILLGLAAYLITGMEHFTSLIPSIIGLLIFAVCLIASRGGAGTRKIMMHLAALLALLGFILPLGRLIPVSIKNGFELDVKSGSIILTSVICLIFLLQCIASFRAARKRLSATNS